jgi:soluble lytic murein transglycosylase-like protein
LLAELVEQFGNLGLAAAAYNAGPKRVQDWVARKRGLPAETRKYVQSITGRAAEHWVLQEEKETEQFSASCPIS